jgi:hypothetical protein
LVCDASTPELHELFIRCVGAVVEQLPIEATTEHLATCVQSLLDLFRALNGPDGREIAGLWAELFVITQANDIPAAVRAWHADTFELFDFSWPDVVLEVKAAQGTIRTHEFGLDQLNPPNDLGLVASLLLRPLTTGVGVMDLATKIDAALQGESELRQRLWENFAEALGTEFESKLDRRFDPSFAERNITLFDMKDVPAPDRPADPRVTSIRFRSDMTTVASSLPDPTLKALKKFLRYGHL